MHGPVKTLSLIVMIIFVFTKTQQCHSNQFNIVRDAEIENIIEGYARPIFNSAGLTADNIQIRMLNNLQVNAFVLGGQRIFINTGLIIKASNPNEVIGVLAHETGHISGGHHARIHQDLDRTNNIDVLSMFLGAALGYATRDVSAGFAVSKAGKGLAIAERLKYSRMQEASADSAALKYLDITGQSAKGMKTFFEKINNNQLLMVGQKNPYLSSHPVTTDRIILVENHLHLSRYTDVKSKNSEITDFEMMRAKIIGFTLPYKKVHKIYPVETDNSQPAIYARSISNYLRGDLIKALPIIEKLIKRQPKNPFLYELKGQMLFENGKIKESLLPYKTSVKLAPNEPLLRINLAKAQIELNTDILMQKAKSHLNLAATQEPAILEIWRLLSIVYGRLGMMGEMVLSQAEFQLLSGNYQSAKVLSDRATKKLNVGSPQWLRSQDIKAESLKFLKLK
ncbi:MAG: M48 family metalloprotease [Alphaproteobacteria bacterium]